MSYSLVNVPTGDGYPGAGPGAILVCPGSRSVAVTIANAAVLYQLGRGGQGGAIQWEANEHFAVPGVWTIGEPIDAIQFKSAKAGTPGQVSVSAYAG